VDRGYPECRRGGGGQRAQRRVETAPCGTPRRPLCGAAASAPWLLSAGPGRSDGVELIRVVEDRRLCGPRRTRVVMRSDRMQELGAHVRHQTRRAFLYETEPQMDVAEQLSFGRLRERRPRHELDGAPDVVEQ